MQVVLSRRVFCASIGGILELRDLTITAIAVDTIKEVAL